MEKELFEELFEENLQELEQEYFYLEMKDHWNSEDYKYAAKLKEK